MMEYFKCFYSYAQKTKGLSDEQVGKLFRALMQYAGTGEEPELDDMTRMAFDFIAYDIDAGNAGYAIKCATNRKNAEEAAAARAARAAMTDMETEPEAGDGPVYTMADVIRSIDRESLRVASLSEDPEGLTVTAELPESVRKRLDANASERQRTPANASERMRARSTLSLSLSLRLSLSLSIINNLLTKIVFWGGASRRQPFRRSRCISRTTVWRTR